MKEIKKQEIKQHQGRKKEIKQNNQIERERYDKNKSKKPSNKVKLTCDKIIVEKFFN